MKTKYKILLAVGLAIFAVACIFGGQALADREQQKQLAEWQAQQTISPTSEPSEATVAPQVTPTVTATPGADSSPEAVATKTPTSDDEAEAGNNESGDTVIVDEDGNETIIPDFEHQSENADKLTKPDELGAEANMNGGGGYIPTKDGVYYGDDYDYGESETPSPSPAPAASATPSPTPTATPKPTPQPAATPAPTTSPKPSASQSTGTQLASYKIEYYEQNADKSGYQCTKVTISDYGKVGETVTAKFPKEYDGFVFNENHPDNLISGIVTADGSLVLKAYFDRAETSTSSTQKPTQTATPDNDDWGDPPDYEGSEHFELSPDGKWVWIDNNGNGFWEEYHRVGYM